MVDNLEALPRDALLAQLRAVTAENRDRLRALTSKVEALEEENQRLRRQHAQQQGEQPPLC